MAASVEKFELFGHSPKIGNVTMTCDIDMDRVHCKKSCCPSEEGCVDSLESGSGTQMFF